MQMMKIHGILFVAFLALVGAVEEVPQSASAAQPFAEMPSIPVALALKLNARIRRQSQRLFWTTQRALINRISSYDNENVAVCIRNCPATNQWKPVCGTDNLSYANMNKLRCAQMCGKQVSHVYNGSCVTTEPPTNTSPNYV